MKFTSPSSQSLLRACWDFHPDKIFIWNEDGLYINYQKLNPHSSTIIPPEDFIERHILDVIPPPYNKTVFLTFRETIRTQSPQFTVIDLQQPAEHPYSVFISMIPLERGALGLAKDFPNKQLQTAQTLITLEDLQADKPSFVPSSSPLAFLQDSSYIITLEYLPQDPRDTLGPVLWLHLLTNMIQKLHLVVLNTTTSPTTMTFKGDIHHIHELTTVLNLFSPKTET